MSNETPTDPLRLVPCPFCGGEAERFEMADRAGVRCADIMCAGSHRLPSHGEDYVVAWNRRAAPASPLPEGGGDWINGLPNAPVGSPTWCAWATHEIMNLRAQLPAAPTGDAK